MSLTLYTLSQKNKLTPDVFELVFKAPHTITMESGQFITFLLPEIGGRAYSIAEIKGEDEIVLLIKRWSEENGGRGGSMALCDSNIGDEFKAVGPSGHFVLTQNNNNKLFIGTGTGLVPLYNQILGATESGQSGTLHLLFGIRTQEDIFYTQELDKISTSNPNFTYDVYLSREEDSHYKHGYTTDGITEDIVNNFKEYYICGAPGMIDGVIKKLTDMGVSEENIFTERY
ncbi:FAD-dependent oxidoreductase [Candidatus Gracilibacteria bacterium]|nr:FAD-dependent oxidoreductase [Candidatus Gracilibacteria bacterium]